MNTTSLCIASILISGAFAAEATVKDESDLMSLFDQALNEMGMPEGNETVTINVPLEDKEVPVESANVPVSTAEAKKAKKVHFDADIPVADKSSTGAKVKKVQFKDAPSTTATVKSVQTKTDSKQEVKPEIKPEVKQEVKPEIKPEVKQEVKTEIKPEVKQEVKTEIKPEVKQEVKTEDKPEAKQEVKADGKPEAKEPALKVKVPFAAAKVEEKAAPVAANVDPEAGDSRPAVALSNSQQKAKQSKSAEPRARCQKSAPIQSGVHVVEKPAVAQEANLEALVADAVREAGQVDVPGNKPEAKVEAKKQSRRISSSSSTSSSSSSSVSSSSSSSSSSRSSWASSSSASTSSSSSRSASKKAAKSTVVPSTDDQSKTSAEPAKLNTPPTQNGATAVTLSIASILGLVTILL